MGTSIMHVNSPIPELGGELDVFQPFIDRAMAKEPDDRFQSGEEMVQALAGLEAEHYELIHSQPVTIQIPAKQPTFKRTQKVPVRIKGE